MHARRVLAVHSLTFFFLTSIFSATLSAQEKQPANHSEQGLHAPIVKAKKKRAAKAAAPVTAQAAQAATEKEKNEGPWKALTWRLIGPFRGGRVLAVAGIPGDTNTYYFGAVGGGVWKTTDGGLNWKPIFDKVKDASPSIGAIAVAESDPNVIYVGTGEACIRGNIIGGNGVYKSTDAGKTWKYTGLKDTHAIGRLVVHPKNSDVAFVAALGHPFAPNPERGIFRTTDGGKNWQKVLFVDDKTGGIDITFDPSNPSILFAAMWQAVRTPYSLESGGPGSGLYRSSDGGDTWKRLDGEGLPKGIMGRIGVTVSPDNPNRVWALIEADKGGLFRSDDGGEKWTLINDDRRFRQRAWYYTHIFADPKSADSVYILNTGVYRSNDGGKTFATLRVPHGDNHGLWIDPTSPKRMINSNDGGATISSDYGESWSTEYNQPTAQFYHVSTDNRFPYYTYGAQQDNSTVAIASAGNDGSIDRPDWYPVGGGESGYIAPDPNNPQIVYAGSYGGEITRYDHRTGQTQEVTPWPLNPIGKGAADVKYRFQWTEPIVFSPHDPKTLYFASQVLFKTTDNGMSWSVISPDLTRNDISKQQPSGGPITKDNTGVEVYDTIFSVVESPVQKDLIWAGSDDGLVHITQDGGKNWTNVTPKAMPDWGLVSMIEASPKEAGTAYMAVERHKLDDFTPYIFKTSDSGKTWTKITNGIPDGTYVHAVRVDPARAGLLYAGTEGGVYVSFNDGENWQSLQQNLPVSPVNDLVVHANDLVAATHGRSFWILDDLSPLRQYQQDVANENVHLFNPAPASHTVFESSQRAQNAGKNPPAGAVIYYWLKTAIKKEEPKAKKPLKAEAMAVSGAKTEGAKQEETKPVAEKTPALAETVNADSEKKESEITLEVLNGSGKVIRKFPPKKEEADVSDEGSGPRNKAESLPAEAGLNRFVWDLKYEGASKVPKAPLWGGSTDGPEAVPGNYQVKLTVQGKSYTARLEIKPDPRLTVTQADLEKQFDLLLQIRNHVTQVHDAVNQIRDLRAQINSLDKRLAETKDPRSKTIADAGKDLDKKMTTVEEALIQTKAKSGQDILNYPIRLNNELVALGGAVASADSAPTQQSYVVFDLLSRQAGEQLAKWKAIVDKDIPAFNQTVRNQDIPAISLASATR